MSEPVRVTVTKGPYATVRAIEKSGVETPARSGIIAETDRTYIYEVYPGKRGTMTYPREDNE